MAETWTQFLTTLGVALAGALVLVLVVHLVVRLLARRSVWAGALLRRARVPFRLFVLAATLSAVVANARPEDVSEAWWDRVALVCRLFTIGSGAWLLAAALIFLEDLGLQRYRTDVADNRVARRVKTQGLIIRRLTVAVVVLVALGAALYSFPGVQAIGASVLASAGLLSIVAAVAAQSTLANLIAGLQVAFSDAIRLDDVVIVEDEWGWIEEITLATSWSGCGTTGGWCCRRRTSPRRRSRTGPGATPSSSAPSSSTSTGASTSRPCGGADRLLERTELWDGRAKVLQVTDAVGGLVRVRVLVTATDAATLFDLRCHVREELVSWLQVRDQDGLPRQRVEVVEHEERRTRRTPEGDRPGLFSGDAAGDARAARFRSGEQENAAQDQATRGWGVPRTVGSVVTTLRQRLGAVLFQRVAGPDGARHRVRIHGTPGPRWFEAGSPISRVHGDASMFVGGLRAVLLQTLHPAAMTAVAEHSGYRGDMWGRLARTSRFLAVTTFGTADDAQQAVDVVRAIHARVTGTTDDGTPYAASDPHLLLWVHVAEIESFLLAHQTYGARPLDQAGRDEYVAQTAEVARRLGVIDPPTTEAELAEVVASFRPELGSRRRLARRCRTSSGIPTSRTPPARRTACWSRRRSG